MNIVPDRGYALRKRRYKIKTKPKERTLPSVKLSLPDGRSIEIVGWTAGQIMSLLWEIECGGIKP